MSGRKRIFIAGAAGLVGQNLIAALPPSEFDIVAVDRNRANLAVPRRLRPEVTALEADPAAARRLLEVNFLSPAALSLAAISRLEASAAPAPALTSIGSVAGDRGRAWNFIYGAAKGGLAILYQGLAHRLARRGSRVRAAVIKAGFVDTPMTAAFPKGGPLWATPEVIAGIVVAAMERGGPMIYAPWFWRWILLAIRLLPQSAMNALDL